MIIIIISDTPTHRAAAYITSTTIVINTTHTAQLTTIPDLTDSESSSEDETDNDTMPSLTDIESETESENDSGFEDQLGTEHT